jgi:recombination protein RecT
MTTTASPSSAAARLRQVATAPADERQERERVANMRPKEQIAYLLTKKKAEIAAMLPAHLNAERLLKVAQIAATTTPALLKCDVASLVGAIAQCAQMGLEPNTVLGHAYLVPFNTRRTDPTTGEQRWVNSVQVIVGYKGLIDLARRSGQIVSIAAHEVCHGDKFDLAYGLEERLEHRPAIEGRGEVIGFYAVAKLVGGGYAFEWMSREQIERVRDGSQGWQQALKFRKEAQHPWAQHFVEMGRKTVIRRLAKYLPLSIEFAKAVALDEAATAGRDQNLDAIDSDAFPIVDEEAAAALTDEREEQEERRVPVAPEPQAEPEPVPAEPPRARATRAKPAPEPVERPSALAQFRSALERADATADQETAWLLIDEARSISEAIDDDQREAAHVALSEAIDAIKAKFAG